MPDQIEVDIPKSQSKSLLPTKEQHPSTLDLKPTPGLLALHNRATNKTPAVNQTGYFIGRVLGMRASLSGDGKSKYRLPHLNMEPGQYLEDYVIYAALDESATRNVETQDPEKVFFEMSKLTSGAQSKFEFDKNDPEKVKIWKKYLSTMTQHVVLAPKHSSSIMSVAPKAGTRIKIYLFQPHQISPGTIIHGLYEQEYDENIFSTGLAQLEEFFKGFNQLLSKAADEMQKAFRDLRNNVPSAIQQQKNGDTATSQTDPTTSSAMNNTALRQYINELSEQDKYDYFSTLVPSNGGTFKTGLNEKNIVGFRTETSTYANNKKGQYDDLFFLVWLDSNGNKKAAQYVGNTEPAATWLDPETKKGTSLEHLTRLSRIKAGFMTYVTYFHPTRGRILMLKPGTKQGVETDANNNGLFDDGVERFGNPQMLFHKGNRVTTGSAGCQTMPGEVFERFMNDIHSGGGDNQELGYTLIDENTITVPEAEKQTSTESNPQETSTEKPIESDDRSYVEQ